VDSTSDPLAGFTESFTSLLSFKEEYRTMALDEVVVGAIAQTVSLIAESPLELEMKLT
jgi:tuftelin-interacting protein 11